MQNMPIAIFRGDDTDALGYQTIVGTIRTDLNLTGCKAVFKYLSFSAEFDPIPEDKKLTVIIPASETSKFPPGLGYASLRVYDAEGKLCTFSNRIMVFVATKTPMFGNAEFEVDFNVRPELEPLKIFVGPNPDDFDEYRGFLEKVIDRASAEKYGLAILLDAIDSDLGANDGVAATPVAVKAAYAAIIKKLTDDYYTADETDEAIDRVAAYYITYDAAGNPFPTYAALANATTVYSGGQVRTPTRNDYCVVLADETHDNAEYRYIYAVADGETTGSWQPQFPVEGVMTVDPTVTRNSQNPVASSGIWSAIWGTASTAFSSLYDWCVAQLAGKASKSDATLTERGFSEWNVVCSNPEVHGVVVYDSHDRKYMLYDSDKPDWLFDETEAIWPEDSATSLQFSYLDGDLTFIATREALLGYRLGPDEQTNPNRDKPVASEAEAEALRQGKQDALSDAQLDNIDAVTGIADLLVRHIVDVQGVDIAVFVGYRIPWGISGYIEINEAGIHFYHPPVHGGAGADYTTAFPFAAGTLALAAPNPTAGNLAALDANGNPTDSGIAAGDLLTIVALTNSAETMASILARLNAINAARQHVFFDCSGIDVNPRLYLCTIMIDADANAVRVYDQVTGKLYIGPYDATETIGEVFAKAVDAYHSITVSAVTLDGVTVTGQTVTIREGTDATAPVYATATITDGAPVVFVVPKGMIYFLEITDTLADHFGPRVTSGARQGIATADAAVTFTYYDAEHIDVSEITTFAKLQEALTWFGTNETAARNNLVGIELADTWTATNGIVYDNPRVVWDVHYFEDENGVRHLGALMGTKYCSYNDVQFDEAEGEECDSSTETVAEAGVYYYGLALGQTSKTAANLTLLELSEGAALPYADYAKIYKSAIRDTTRNSLQYGYNNWRDSAYRQYLNSDAATGQWWGATHIGDVAPSQLNSVRGFMAGCSAALLAAAKKVKVATWPNYITDGPNQITTLYETLDTFFLPSGSEVYGDVNRSGGASVEGELSPYWQARTGYTAPNNTATSTRIIYRELPVGSTASRSAASVRLRSASRGSSTYVWYVNTSGQVTSNHANAAYASVPACVIY